MTRSTCIVGLGLAVSVAGCEPASVTEARDQLARGGERDVVFTMTIRRDTIFVADVLSDFLDVDFITILDSLAAVPILPVEASVSIDDSVGTISGVLDPTTNPALTFEVEESQQVPEANLDLGQLEDAIRNLTVNTALLVIVVENEADAPITLSDFTIGVAPFDVGANDVARDPGGNPLYEVDDMGQPILVALPSSGSGAWSIPRTGTVTDTLNAGPLVDRLVDLLLDGVPVALVEAGTVVVGDGSTATITAGNSLRITVEPLLGFDFTFGTGTVAFDSSTVLSGLDLDTTSVVASPDAVAQLVDSAGVTVSIQNGTAFQVVADIAAVQGNVAGNVFVMPDRVDLGSVTVAPASVDGEGRAVTPGASTSVFQLSGQQARVFFGPEFTAGLAVELRGPIGGRAALRPGDRIVFDVVARVKLRTGAGP